MAAQAHELSAKAAALLLAILVAAILPTPIQAQGASFPLTDAADDVRLHADGNPVPANAPDFRATPFVDILSLEADDPTEAAIEFRLKVAGALRSTTEGFVAVESIHYFVGFRLGSATDLLLLHVGALLAPDGSFARPGNAEFCSTTSEREGCRNTRGAFVHSRVEEGVLVFQLPKDFLLRARTPLSPRAATQMPERLSVGDELEDVRATAWSSPTPGFEFNDLRVRYTDRAPEAGGAPYVLKRAANPPDLVVIPSRGAVVEGETTIVPVSIMNLRAAKRLVNLSATVVGTQEAPWRVNITGSALLAPMKATNVSLRITAPALEATNRAKIRIQANVLNEPGTRHVTDWGFLAVPAWTATNNVFRIHRQYFGNLGVPASGVSFEAGLLSRAETEPGMDDGKPLVFGTNIGFIGANYRLFSGPYAPDGMREALPNPVTVRPELAKVHLEVDAPFKLEASIRIHLGSGPESLGEASVDRSLNEGPNVLDLDVPLNPRLNRLVPGEHDLDATIWVRDNTPTGLALTLLSAVKPLTLRPKVSTITIPIDREPEPVARDHLPRVGLAASEDLEAYVNTGEQTVFEVDLRNEDTRRLTLLLEVGNQTPEWTAEVRPSDKATLAPGGEVRLGVVVGSPRTAKEGDFSFAILRVRLPETGEEVASLKFRVTNTDGIMLENETFEARAEDLDELPVRAKGKSPTLALEAGAALLVAGYATLRRRKD